MGFHMDMMAWAPTLLNEPLHICTDVHVITIEIQVSTVRPKSWIK